MGEGGRLEVGEGGEREEGGKKNVRKNVKNENMLGGEREIREWMKGRKIRGREKLNKKNVKNFGGGQKEKKRGGFFLCNFV